MKEHKEHGNTLESTTRTVDGCSCLSTTFGTRNSEGRLQTCEGTAFLYHSLQLFWTLQHHELLSTEVYLLVCPGQGAFRILGSFRSQ